MTSPVAETLTLNGLDVLSRVHDTAELGGLLAVPARRTEDVEVGGGHGLQRVAWKRYDSNTIVLTMWVHGLNLDGTIPAEAAERATFYARVREIIAVLGGDTVTVEHGLPDGSVRRIVGEVVAAVDPTRKNPGSLGQLGIKIHCAYPFWVDVGAELTATGTSTGPANPWTLTAFAGHDAPLDDLVLRFTATTGTVPNPRVERLGCWLRYIGTLTAGQWVEFDNATWEVRSGGGHTARLQDHAKGGNEPQYWVCRPSGLAALAAPVATLSHTGTGLLTATARGRRKHLVG